MAKKADVRGLRLRQVEQLVASGMDVSSWCKLNKVDKAALYDWMREFRDTDPEVFGGYDLAHAGDGKRNWFECVRKAIAASTAIEKADSPVPATTAPAFAVVDAESLSPGDAARTPAGPITVKMRCAEVLVPPGSASSDIAAVLSAVALL